MITTGDLLGKCKKNCSLTITATESPVLFFNIECHLASST